MCIIMTSKGFFLANFRRFDKEYTFTHTSIEASNFFYIFTHMSIFLLIYQYKYLILLSYSRVYIFTNISVRVPNFFKIYTRVYIFY